MKIYYTFITKLKGKTIKALVWSFFSNFWSKIISFIISIFLARLLEPEEFGIIGITLAFTAILHTISNLGFSSALIQFKKIEKGMYSSVFWFNVICSLILYFLLFILSNYISAYFKINELALVLKIIGLMLLFDALSIIQRTNLKRKLDFKSIAIRNITADLTGGILGVISAFYGLGVYALVVQHIVKSIVGVIMYWYLSDWRPQFIFIKNHLKQLFSFSIFKFIDSITRTSFEKISVFFIASTFNPTILGLYSRSESFSSFLTQTIAVPLTNVLFPSFSKIQDEKLKFKNYAILSLRILTFFLSIPIGLLYFWSNDLIITLFGVKWFDSVPIIKILILASFTNPLKITQSSWLLGKGYSKYVFYINLIGYFFTAIAISIGVFSGFYTFLWILTSGRIISYFIQTIIVSKILKYDLIELMKITLGYLTVTYFAIYFYEFYFEDIIFNKFIISLVLITILALIFLINIKVLNSKT